MNLPDFISIENIVTVGGAVIGLFGWDKYKTKARATAKGVLALANSLAAAYRAIPAPIRPRLQDFLMRKVPALKTARAKEVLALAEKLIIQASLAAVPVVSSAVPKAKRK